MLRSLGLQLAPHVGNCFNNFKWLPSPFISILHRKNVWSTSSGVICKFPVHHFTQKGLYIYTMSPRIRRRSPFILGDPAPSNPPSWVNCHLDLSCKNCCDNSDYLGEGARQPPWCPPNIYIFIIYGVCSSWTQTPGIVPHSTMLHSPHLISLVCSQSLVFALHKSNNYTAKGLTPHCLEVGRPYISFSNLCG